jgi:hypothetical protein
MILLLAGVTLWVHLRDVRAKHRVLRNLRRLPRESHTDEIARFLDYHFRAWLRHKISEERLPEHAPPVERFVFPAQSHAFNDRALGIVLAAAILPAVALFRVRAGTAGQGVAAVALTSLLGLAWWLRRRAAYLHSVIEISPFAIREVHASGLRRTLLWNDARWLINRGRLGRVDITSSDRRDRISVHYDRLEFYKALERIIQYGGFGPSDAAA